MTGSSHAHTVAVKLRERGGKGGWLRYGTVVTNIKNQMSFKT